MIGVPSPLSPLRDGWQVSDFKQELLFSAGVAQERITEFSCGERPLISARDIAFF